MKHKNKFIKSTIILIIGGIITKILGFFIRIIYTRIVGTEVIGLYSLVIAEAVNIIYIVYKNYHKIKKVLRYS